MLIVLLAALLTLWAPAAGVRIDSQLAIKRRTPRVLHTVRGAVGVERWVIY